jgi:tRNA U55 pseudouridine synthase TruB
MYACARQFLHDLHLFACKLHGDILQVPAAVSAIKINSVRSYRRMPAGPPL